MCVYVYEKEHESDSRPQKNEHPIAFCGLQAGHLFWKSYMIFVRQMVIFFMENEKLFTSRISRRKIANDSTLGRVEAN